MEKQLWPRSVAVPIILIALGIALLLGNVFKLEVWDILIRLWPVWLIAIGLDLLVGRQNRIASIAVAAVTLVILGGGIWFYAVRGFGDTQLTTVEINQPLNGATKAHVEIRPSVGQFSIHEAQDPASLISGTVHRLGGETIQKDASNSGDTAYFTLRSQFTAMVPNFGRDQRGRWDLGLNPTIPLDLIINTGVGQAQIDLSGLKVYQLDMNTGVGESTITLPRQSTMRGQIKTGVGQTTILIPDGVAARIQARQGLGALRVDGEFNQQGNTYTSPDWEKAEVRIDLEVSGGVGEVRVLRTR